MYTKTEKLWELRARLGEAKSGYKLGMWGIVLGLLLFLVYWPLGMFVLITGVLAAVTQFWKYQLIQDDIYQIRKHK